jgi:RNA polymerase sigma factor (sigma-70 family)
MTASEADLAAEIFSTYGSELLGRARALVRSEMDAEDAVQEAMLAIVRAPHLLSVVEKTGAWLYTLVRRRCVDIIRRDSSRRRDEYEAALEDLFQGTDAHELMERKEFVQAVATAAGHLDEPLRFAFVENALEGKTFEQISQESGVPMGTLMARKKGAVELIRKQMRQRGLLP